MRVLIVHTRSLCYFSAEFFLDRIEEALEHIGVEVVRCNIPEGEDFSGLNEFDGESFDSVLDINSKLPYLKNDEGDFWLDKLEAPFFNYILDHPLYHHPGLVFPLKNYHAIGIDRAHCRYMEENYPHLKSVTYQPVPGTPGIASRPYGEREEGLLFMGTHVPERKREKELKFIRETFGSDIRDFIIETKESWDPYKQPLEEFVNFPWGFDEPESRSFAENMNLIYLVDRIKREEVREEILLALSKEVLLVVAGEGWEESALSKERVELIPPLQYGPALMLNGRYKYVLDISPGFFCGIHDRASNALASGALLMTNMSKQVCPELKDGKELIYYAGLDVENVVNAMELSNGKAEEIANAGHKWQKNNLSWEAFAKRFVKMTKEAKET